MSMQINNRKEHTDTLLAGMNDAGASENCLRKAETPCEGYYRGNDEASTMQDSPDGFAKWYAEKKGFCLEKIYSYCYGDYNDGLHKLRFIDEEGKKVFRWIHRNSLNRSGWGMERGDCRHRLYIAGNPGDKLVILVEGEKDADTVWSKTGITAVSAENGAGTRAKWKNEYSLQLQGKQVYILGDNDPAGQAYVQIEAERLAGCAEKVFCLDIAVIWPECPDKGDVSAFFDAKGMDEGTDLLVEAMESATEFLVPAATEAESDWTPARPSIGISTIENILAIFKTDKKLAGSIKGNRLANAPYIVGRLPWETDNCFREWKNADDASLRNYLEARYQIDNKNKIDDAFAILIEENWFNPVVTMLNGIHSNKWDKEKGHIRALLTDYLGCEDTEYNEKALTIFMLGAICRAVMPGCKFDYCLTIQGSQGIGKSTFLRHLALRDEWFNDNFRTIEGKEAFENLRGMWICEMAELLATKKASHVESVKAFITSGTDRYRAPYERRAEAHPRMCVFAATVNDTAFLADQTGNRRWLIITADKAKVKKSLFLDPESVMMDFDNAWGEAMQLFLDADGHPNLVLPEELAAVAEAQQQRFSEIDPRVGIIEEFLSHKMPGEKTCIAEIYSRCFDPDKVPDRKTSRALAQILDLKIEDWGRYKDSKDGKTYFDWYGKQVAWVKTEERFTAVSSKDDLPF